MSHLCLVSLASAGLVHHIVSQNVDNLHVKSGLPRRLLSELHGNIFVGECRRCRQQHYFQHDLGGMGRRRLTARCPSCPSQPRLYDDAVDWSTPLPQHEFDRAEAEMRRAELVLCLGSSLRVQPAGSLPRKALFLNGRQARGRLVIVNLQQTHLDAHCSIRLWGRCDRVMAELCRLLSVDIPAWDDTRRPPMPPWPLQRRQRDRGGAAGLSQPQRSKRRASGAGQAAQDGEPEEQRSAGNSGKRLRRGAASRPQSSARSIAH